MASVLSAWIVPSGSNVSVLAAPIGLRGLRRRVGQRERPLLVRDRDVDAAEARGRQRPDGLGEQLRRQRQALVAPVVQAERGERRVVHLRRARVRHRPPAHAEAGHFPSRELWYFWTSRSNCASVEENACSPRLARACARRTGSVLLRRLRGGLDRRQAGVADRRRREPAVDARVVRLLGVELGLPDRALPVVRVVADRRVDPQRHALLEAVVDDRRHQRALARQLRLALDHRGDDQHVVAR